MKTRFISKILLGALLTLGTPVTFAKQNFIISKDKLVSIISNAVRNAGDEIELTINEESLLEDTVTDSVLKELEDMGKLRLKNSHHGTVCD